MGVSMEEIKIKRLEIWLKRLIPDHYKAFDLKKLYDSKLSYEDNKKIIREHVKHLVSLDNYYKDIKRAILKVVQGYSHLAFIKGRGGIGKSRTIRRVLEGKKIDYVELSGDVTEAYLYRILYENNGKVVWFKDVSKLLKGLKSVNLLKAATETEDRRLVTKSTYSIYQADLPDSFEWKGSIIFDYNDLKGIALKEDFEALVSRGDFVEFTLSVEDIKEIMRLIAQTPKEKETTEFLIDNYEHTGFGILNLRTQYKAIRTRDWADKNGLNWKVELKSELSTIQSQVKKMLCDLIGFEPIRTTELKKLLLKSGYLNSLRSADRKISEWIVTEDLYKWSNEDKNFYVATIPKQ
jgi:hypothetical protein